MPYKTSTEEWLKSLAPVRSQTGGKSYGIARGYWTKPDRTEKYGPEWEGWEPVGWLRQIRGRPGDRELPPIVDPSAKAAMPRARLDEMLARNQLTGSEYALALMFQANPCGASVLKGYYAIVVGIVIHDRPAEELADPRVGRSRGIKEVMRKLQLGLRLMVDHYLPEDSEHDEEAARLDPEAFRQTDFYKRLQERERDSNDNLDPSRGYFALAPQPASETFGAHYSTHYSKEFGHCGGSLLSVKPTILPVSIGAHVSAWWARKPGGYGAPKWRGQMAKKMWSAQMHRASAIKAAWSAMAGGSMDDDGKWSERAKVG
jgi:hypothetical protein